jgi:hypothetical protein
VILGVILGVIPGDRAIRDDAAERVVDRLADEVEKRHDSGASVVLIGRVAPRTATQMRVGAG